MAKKLHIKTWGCQMNVYDSGRMADVVAPLGYAPSDNADDADLVIFNTCHIREKATEKLFSELGRVRTMQADKAPRQRMIVAWPDASRRLKARKFNAALLMSIWFSDRRPIINCRK